MKNKLMTATESQIEKDFIQKLVGLKYTYRDDIRDKVALEQNFRQKFEALNRVHLTDAEFARLRDEMSRQTSSLLPAFCARKVNLSVKMVPRWNIR